MSEDKELLNTLTLALKEVVFKDFVPTNGVKGKDRYVSLHHSARERLVKRLLPLIHADRQRWLKELLPEKDFPKMGSENYEIYEAYSHGFNSCLSLIKEKAGIKE